MPTGKHGIRFVFDDFVHIAVSYSTAELKSGKTIAAGAASIYADGNFSTDSQIGISPRDPAVVPPFLGGLKSRGYAAILSFCIGVMPPMPILGRSLLYVQSHSVT